MSAAYCKLVTASRSLMLTKHCLGPSPDDSALYTITLQDKDSWLKQPYMQRYQSSDNNRCPNWGFIYLSLGIRLDWWLGGMWLMEASKKPTWHQRFVWQFT